MAPKTKIPESELRHTANIFRKEYGNQKATAERMGMSRSAIQNRLDLIRHHHPEWLDNIPEKPAEEPAKPRTLDDDVKLERSAAEVREMRAKMRDAARLIASLQDQIKDLSWAAEASYDPAEWASPRRTARRHEHLPYLFTSDFHCGEKVSASETEAGYGYDSNIFVARYRYMIDSAIYLCDQHVGRDWIMPGFVYARGGDAISGQLHPELIETDDLTPLEAVQLVAEEEMGGLRKLADHFGRVEVKTPGSGGNHDRDLFKPTTKKAARHNLDRLIEYMLRREFKDDPRVTFQTSNSFDIRFPIYNQNILLTHGDRIGTRGGQGFIGPAATILRGMDKVVREQASLGHHIDQVHMGHFHYPMMLPFLISNGSMPGYTEYAKQFRMRPQVPQQTLCFFHPKRGIVDYKPIILTGAS